MSSERSCARSGPHSGTVASRICRRCRRRDTHFQIEKRVERRPDADHSGSSRRRGADRGDRPYAGWVGGERGHSCFGPRVARGAAGRDAIPGAAMVNRRRRRKRKGESENVVMARKYLIETFGCQMNVHDSERMAGHARTGRPSSPRRTPWRRRGVINTCSVRERAEEKLYTRLGELAQIKNRTRSRPVWRWPDVWRSRKERPFSGVRAGSRT